MVYCTSMVTTAQSEELRHGQAAAPSCESYVGEWKVGCRSSTLPHRPSVHSLLGWVVGGPRLFDDRGPQKTRRDPNKCLEGCFARASPGEHSSYFVHGGPWGLGEIRHGEGFLP